MKIKYTFATRTLKEGRIVNARQRYNWHNCGSFALEENASERAFEEAKKFWNIPKNAFCVKSELVTD
jgi:hypothetical protein